MSASLKKQYEKILTGELQFSFTSLGPSLLFTRLISKYKANPTPSELNNCLAEVDAFVSKYHQVLAGDLATLEKM